MADARPQTGEAAAERIAGRPEAPLRDAFEALDAPDTDRAETRRRDRA